MRRPSLLRVASVPASHVYVRHLADPADRGEVIRLPDPVPADGRKVPGGWWPPLMLEPGWVSANHELFDVFHIHFGFDAVGADVLTEVMQELKDYDKPLVYTVHDLRNPHHHDPAEHILQQDVLVAAADVLITLTPGAAQEIRRRWDKHAHVLAHPHVLERPHIEAPRPPAERFVVGVHVKSRRANMDPLPVLEVLAGAVKDLPDALLRIDIHDEVFDPGNHWYAPRFGESVLAFDRREHVEVCVHPYFSDTELWEYLAGLSVSVLPYRFGTHSGWLEACFDLGTAVIAPSCGFYAEQRPCGVFTFTEEEFDPRSLESALHQAYDRWRRGTPAPRATWPGRLTERALLAEAHRTLYERTL
ncbi:glycosyltransferase family 1 protein [Mycobacterium sp. ITM-2016-00317]|uniref:glycosyltransferase family 1 protein n=1 Tax=Mycobacterium sp. ITM-2016-00317 TaxID=2099694 RepID=UPI00287FE404|nr:glycosyltransferase family 1 protein [Mycobacterium sp. ITM-2016-00317]WNG87509.1 glycosyltransferase family 1 protein [Mycobacterium sp. ITM-2016-00317]